MTSTNARLAARFASLKGRAALIPYVTAGDPLVASTPALMHALAAAGADVIELGVPFSDPMADGPVIQQAGERAIAAGVSLDAVLDIVAEFRRQDDSTPVVLMGYANPIECMGPDVFVQRAAQAGVDGVLTVDYTPEESAEFAALLGQAGLDPIYLLAPTSVESRIRDVARLARGYVYYVSLKGVTGAGHLDTDDVARHLADIRRHVRIPVGVGFGIRDAESAARVAQHADAVVIGSKLIQIIEEASLRDGPQAAIGAAAQWLAQVRQAIEPIRKQG
ncbi:MAG: tryptophan synthase subunit alpha [Castellaniella sp.]|uniref:tryptophan synthase subunit alpha n=1 Tax=Castellaniella sp. TaxID=1955812 RepID=UPI002A36B248|nr:tryptophan synthase subunit alpha [Castellaniella sp.]MDY0309384.1 tryptophan synthase subunit alpha [Castellaniella sp.]